MKLNIEKDYYNDSFDGGGDDGDGDDDADGDHDDESFLQTVVWKSSDVAWKRHNLLTTRPVSEWVNYHDDDDDYGDDGDGFPANSPHDKIPPWWEYIINRWGGFLSPAYSHHW